MISRLLTRINDSRGQVLPLALAALALGALLVSPFLVDASVNLLASRRIDSAIKDYYSADAGVEWALWLLKGDSELTDSASYTEAPLQPTPPAVNGSPFPTTEIRRVAGADLSETISPDWQSGGGAKCYDFTSTESGLVFAVVDVQANNVWITLLDGSDDCQKPPGLAEMSGTTPYELQFSDLDPGPYRLLIETAPAGTGTLTINYPLATYDIRSERNGRTITSRVTAGDNTVRVVSWQLESTPEPPG
jgi:hypothetical protein